MSAAPGMQGPNMGAILSSQAGQEKQGGFPGFLSFAIGQGLEKGMLTETNVGQGFSIEQLEGFLDMFYDKTRGTSVLTAWLDVFESKEDMFKLFDSFAENREQFDQFMADRPWDGSGADEGTPPFTAMEDLSLNGKGGIDVPLGDGFPVGPSYTPDIGKELEGLTARSS